MDNNPVEHFDLPPAEIVAQFKDRFDALMDAKGLFRYQELTFKKDAPFYIKGLRMEKGLSQEALATAIGVDDTYISKVENDRVVVTYELLRKIMVYMDGA